MEEIFYLSEEYILKYWR